MILYLQQQPMFLSRPKNCRSPSLSVIVGPGLQGVRRAKNVVMCAQGPEQRIREMFTKVELSVSSYDTAWIAMVPSLNSPQQPCFPQCLNWLLENQLPDGSWGLPCRHPLLIKDSLSSTLACVLALKRWEVGEEHMRRGLNYIEINFGAAANDKQQESPIGFDIIFPGMIEYCKDLGLNLPLSSSAINAMIHKRDLEFTRCNSEGKKAYLAYVAEGLVKLQDWEEVMKYQRKNGSLFNSPSTTAAALTHVHDAKCFEYLCSVLERFNNAVPTVYPLDIYTRLCMVDTLERLGIDRHFRNEIKSVLDETYRCWLERDEEIFLDICTHAMAFRLLRMNGYEISSDALAEFEEKEHFFSSTPEHLKCTGTILELYKASQIMIFQNEPVLEKLHSWTRHFLKQKLSNGVVHEDRFHKEVDYALKYPYIANAERLENRRHIECYNVDSFQILKTSYRCLNINNRDFLKLAVEDFNICQAILQKELKHLERWVKENRLDQLKFARQKLTYCYFSVASILFSPDQSNARISWAKTAVLVTVTDDFFDVGGCRKEQESLIKLVDKWDGNSATDCCSEQVDIMFSTLHNTINELGAKAFVQQGRSVKIHLIELWLALLKSMMREADWARNKSAPTMEEYMPNACVSFTLGPLILVTLYFLGPELSEEVVRSPEFNSLYNHISICGRLLNDVQSFKREAKEGKLNSVLLHMIHGCGDITEEEAVREIKGVIDSNNKDLLRLVLQTKGSVVPKACKDLFWKANRVFHLFYTSNDGFTSSVEMVQFVNAVLHDPLNLPS